jgi:hypothetical protein
MKWFLRWDAGLPWAICAVIISGGAGAVLYILHGSEAPVRNVQIVKQEDAPEEPPRVATPRMFKTDEVSTPATEPDLFDEKAQLLERHRKAQEKIVANAAKLWIEQGGLARFVHLNGKGVGFVNSFRVRRIVDDSLVLGNMKETDEPVEVIADTSAMVQGKYARVQSPVLLLGYDRYEGEGFNSVIALTPEMLTETQATIEAICGATGRTKPNMTMTATLIVR